MRETLVFSNIEEWEKFRRELLSWKGTPYKHLSRVKGRGVDCNMFIGSVLVECGYLKELNYDYYPKDWWLHTNKQLILDYVEKHRALLRENYDFKMIWLKDKENLKLLEGDYLGFSLLNKKGIINHSGIYLGNNEFIHAAPKRGVCIEKLNDYWKRHLKLIIRLIKRVEN